MARSLNKVLLIGNVGNDPEIKTVASGTKIAKVSLATSRTFNDRSGAKQEKTEWHRLTFWDKLADLVEQYVKKGDRIYIEGRLEYSQTEDQQGQTRYWTDIVVGEMVMLGGSQGGGGGERGGFEGGSRQQQPRRPQQNAPAASPFESDDDDLPF